MLFIIIDCYHLLSIVIDGLWMAIEYNIWLWMVMIGYVWLLMVIECYL